MKSNTPSIKIALLICSIFMLWVSAFCQSTEDPASDKQDVIANKQSEAKSIVRSSIQVQNVPLSEKTDIKQQTPNAKTSVNAVPENGIQKSVSLTEMPENSVTESQISKTVTVSKVPANKDNIKTHVKVIHSKKK